jgi:hypothetical protein
MNEKTKQNNKTIDTTEDLVSEKRKNVKAAVKIYLWCLVGGLLFKGWLAFFVGMGVAPLDTIAELIGMAFPPFIIGWLLAKLLSLAVRKVSFNTLWFAGATLIITLMLVGQWRGDAGT